MENHNFHIEKACHLCNGSGKSEKYGHCIFCMGSGLMRNVAPGLVVCEDCQGEGVGGYGGTDDNGYDWWQECGDCPKCDGQRYYIAEQITINELDIVDIDEDGSYVSCYKCKGTGKIQESSNAYYYEDDSGLEMVDCPKCNGRGSYLFSDQDSEYGKEMLLREAYDKYVITKGENDLFISLNMKWCHEINGKDIEFIKGEYKLIKYKIPKIIEGYIAVYQIAEVLLDNKTSYFACKDDCNEIDGIVIYKFVASKDMYYSELDYNIKEGETRYFAMPKKILAFD